MEENRIHSPQRLAIKVEGESKGAAVKNKLYPGEGTLIQQEQSPLFHISENKIIEDKTRLVNGLQNKNKLASDMCYYLF